MAQQIADSKIANQAMKAPEVVSGGGKDGVDGFTLGVGEIVAPHSLLGFEMLDHRLDR